MSCFAKPMIELMEMFYSNWIEKGMSEYEAFYKAQKEMRNKYTDPYLWSAFVMTF
ncbi:MAG: CHAT domain-containing protein [Ignavibacteriae bacterium]|nr:CHAT domain-containing protein [Ignavibacteriota bacterium]